MRKVIVTIVGTQTDEYGEKNTIELIAVGSYYERNGVHCLTYKESEITGMDGTTTLLKIYGDHFSVIRMGAVEQKQEFYPGQNTNCTYITPFGSMKMSIYTKYMEIAVDKGIGNISASYELTINGQWQSSNTLSVCIREEKEV